MMSSTPTTTPAHLSAPPVLSTPDEYILQASIETNTENVPSVRPSNEELMIRYEISRTIDEIRKRKWRRVALQFPDSMLGDSTFVYGALERGLRRVAEYDEEPVDARDESLETEIRSSNLKVDGLAQNPGSGHPTYEVETDTRRKRDSIRLTILGDTSYGSCCVDEIAAEHIDADAVVHYGRSCLSPTARLPVMYVFTEMELDHEAVRRMFTETFPEKNEKIIVTADTPFAKHVDAICEMLRGDGYTNIFAADIVHDTSSLVPNRTVPDQVKQDASLLSEWSLFHISDPPTSLLLTLSSRVRGIHIYPTSNTQTHQAKTSVILRRRYALITSMSTVSTWGILINTLSVKNYLHIVDHVKKQIADAGKKSYLFVVGKLNAAKVANFAEIGGWVVIGCWESSLVDSKDFYKPIITPFELDLVLKSDDMRVWTGEWRGDFQKVLDEAVTEKEPRRKMPGAFDDEEEELDSESEAGDYDSEEESAPPEFDLRTGKYVSQSRPMRKGGSKKMATAESKNNDSSTALTKRPNGEILSIRGVSSPAAEFLAQKRTWRGLGSDFEIKYEDEEEQGGLIEEGRTGVARGYTVADSERS